MQEIPDNNIGSKSIAHEERLLKISQDLETLLADSVQSNDPHHYYSSTSSDDETTSSGSMFDSDIDETPPKLAYVLHVCKPVYTLRHTKKKPSINLTLKTTRHRYQNSFDSEETHNAGLTSDSSRLSHWASQPSVMSPRTPGEDSDEQHLMLRTMSAPNLGLPLDMQLQLKRLSIQTWYDSEESSLGDTYWPSGKIARRKHIRAIPWRSGFDEAHDDM
ncbi:hypothetical protein BGW37DRAFT_258432 [Umbelopsis sp. PMI_123]|nr:hypothetical protein BGW37DRAFT_258432 [Umbelopsis sp. PMI_123]